MINDHENLSIGLAEVVPRRGSNALGSPDKGANVNVIAYARDPATFRKVVTTELDRLELVLVQLEDVELYSKRVSAHQISPVLMEVAEEVKHSFNVGFGTFHTFPLADDGSAEP